MAAILRIQARSGKDIHSPIVTSDLAHTARFIGRYTHA